MDVDLGGATTTDLGDLWDDDAEVDIVSLFLSSFFSSFFSLLFPSIFLFSSSTFLFIEGEIPGLFSLFFFSLSSFLSPLDVDGVEAAATGSSSTSIS